MLHVWHLLDEFQSVWGTRIHDYFDCVSTKGAAVGAPWVREQQPHRD